MAKKKKNKAAPKKQPPNAIALGINAAMAAMRERMSDPEVQAKLAANFAKLKPQAEAVMSEMNSNRKGKRPETDKVAEEYDLGPMRVVEMPSMAGELTLPTKHVPRAGRLDFYWILDWPHTDKWDNSCAVKASYWKEDSVSTQDVIDGRPGARKGDWTVDIIGYNGAAMFRLHPHHAKSVAEAVLSAVGFENVWRKYYAEHGNYHTEGGEMGEIPHADPGPAVTFAPTEPYAEAMTPDIPTVVPIAKPDNSQSIPGGGTSEGPSFEEYLATGGDASEAAFLGNAGGFGDTETPPAAPRQEHRCCGHCKPDAHAPHTDGCPSGFNIED